MLIEKFTKIITFKSDTDATRNYIRDKDFVIIKNIQPATTVSQVLLPDNSVIQPTHSGYLPLLMLPPAATQYNSDPNLISASLFSILQLCDSNFSALFTKNDVAIFNSDNTSVLNNKWNKYDGLWDVKISSLQTQ